MTLGLSSEFCSEASDEKDSRNLTEKIVDYTGYEEIQKLRKKFLKFKSTVFDDSVKNPFDMEELNNWLEGIKDEYKDEYRIVLEAGQELIKQREYLRDALLWGKEEQDAGNIDASVDLDVIAGEDILRGVCSKMPVGILKNWFDKHEKELELRQLISIVCSPYEEISFEAERLL